jgi:hypothetical protein
VLLSLSATAMGGDKKADFGDASKHRNYRAGLIATYSALRYGFSIRFRVNRKTKAMKQTTIEELLRLTTVAIIPQASRA